MLDDTPLVVVGGGTAGWLTALLAKKYCPEKNVVVVASEEIGILGAGEGTVPHFIEVLNLLDISPRDIIKNCSGTIKLGIDFVNWNGDGESYWHGFDTTAESISFAHMDSETVAYALVTKNGLDALSLGNRLTTENKVPFLYDSPSALTPIGFFGLHFDAHLLAKFLKATAISRGVTYINDELLDADLTPEGHIGLLKFKNTPAVAPLFVFDCTGLRRVLIGGKFKSEWVSYKDQLICTKAMPFFIPHAGDAAPVTSAIAMKYGWVWRIPTQDRYGCGYVFDGEKLSVDDAKKEIETHFNISLPAPRVFDFSPGCYKTPLKNNCLAVGLAHSFIEPMEATSIWGTCLMLLDFFSAQGVSNFSPAFQKSFNTAAERLTGTFKSFILAHYRTNRTDTDFWRGLANSTDPDIETCKNSIENHLFTKRVGIAFQPISWGVILTASSSLDKDKVVRAQNYFGAGSGKPVNPRERFQNRQHKIAELAERCVSHRDFLAIARA